MENKMLPHNASLWPLVSLFVVLNVPFLCLSCDFPEYLQSRRDGPRREWHVHNLDHHRGQEHRYTHVVTFSGSVMQADLPGGTHNTHVHHQPKSYSRRCVLEIEPGQYLVTHNAEGASLQLYMCVEFIKRSDNVMQVKQSEKSTVQDPRLCSDVGMTINNWPFINKASIYQTYEPCPLEGGYSAKFSDRHNHTHVGYCDVYNGETRIESECMAGEGIFFRFRYDKCVPEGLSMHTTQHVYCMGNWEDGEYKFLILRHSSVDHQWCMRIPKQRGNEFNAILFKDLVCDPEYKPKETKDYVAIWMVRDIPQPFNELCRDDYEGCSYWTTPCQHQGSTMHLTCAKMCNVCNATRPSSCTFPSSLQGEWLESNRLGHDIVDIKDTTLAKYQYDKFQCVQWKTPTLEEDTDLVEKMLVSTFDNGCRPRYTCAQFKKHSPSVLHYKLSQIRVWPFYDVNWNNIDCSSFSYKDEDEPAGDTHRSRHFKALISMDTIADMDCGLDEALDLTLIVDDDVTCHGMLTSNHGSVYKNKRLQLLLYDCPNRKPQQEFTCLDSHRHGYISKQIIITESMESSNEYQCWLFPVSPQHTFYLLPMRHCNEGAAEKVSSGVLIPLSTFKIKPKPTTTTSTTTMTQPPSPHIIVENIISIPEDGTDGEGEGYKTDKDKDNLLVVMNDVSKSGNPAPDSYSQTADDGEVKVYESSNGALETAPEKPEAAVNKKGVYGGANGSGHRLVVESLMTVVAIMLAVLH